MKEYIKEWNLSSNEYITEEMVAEMELDSGINLIISDVNTGKSFYFAKQPNTYFVAPLVSIVKSIEGEDVSTWNAKVKAVVEAEDRSVFKDITLVVDECHGLLIDDYKAPLICKLIQCFKYFKSVVLLSGTVDASYFSSFEIDRVYRVTKKQQSKKTINTYITKNTKAAIEEMIVNCDEKAIALINDIDLCNTIKASYEKTTGKKCLVVNSDVKNAKEVVDFYEAKRMGQYDLIIGTDSIREGLSIEDDLETASVFILDHRDPDEIEQFVNRFRKVRTERTVSYVIKNVDYQRCNYEDVTSTDLINDAYLTADSLNNAYNKFSTNVQRENLRKQFSAEINAANVFFSVKNDCFKINKYGIDFQRAKLRSYQSMMDIVTFKSRMQDYDYEVNIIASHETSKEAAARLAKELKAMSETRKAERVTLLSKVKDYFVSGEVVVNPSSSEYMALIESIKSLRRIGLSDEQIPMVVDGAIADTDFISKVWKDYHHVNTGETIREVIVDYLTTYELQDKRYIHEDLYGRGDIMAIAMVVINKVCEEAFGNNKKLMARNEEWKHLMEVDKRTGFIKIKKNKHAEILNKYIKVGKSIQRKNETGFKHRYYKINEITLSGIFIEQNDIQALRKKLNINLK
ncbi:TPA: hypothetical protein MM130_000369 [Klebsiella quasipneumoniae subsp. similipneumoniae]|nr:hypothetical protein [Klebsiella quasipneumoniae subsp. similipneumoniae]HBZ8083604.1 hypothetical protein [Klebsiella quasipneumoniae subsp. similipneumoniae]